MTKQYEISANGMICGVFTADSEQAARDLAAQDAGYKSEADMVDQLEQPSELVAVDLAAKFGTVEFSGKTYTLTNQAQADNHGTEGLVRYYAKAVDADGTEHLVAWDTTQAWDEADKDSGLCDDESNACDWDSPVSVKAV
jgi:hypothetical protein